MLEDDCQQTLNYKLYTANHLPCSQNLTLRSTSLKTSLQNILILGIIAQVL